MSIKILENSPPLIRACYDKIQNSMRNKEKPYVLSEPIHAQ